MLKAPIDVAVLPAFRQAQTGIDEKRTQGNNAAILGAATTKLEACLDGKGFFVHYGNGSIYWHPSFGTHEIHGDIFKKWSALGAEHGLLGYPLTDESVTPDGEGRFNHFQHGSIYWHPGTGAHEVHGDIRARWEQLGWETSPLGYPVTDETGTPDGQGRFSHFQGGSIYWHPDTGAHEVRGDIRARWEQLGWELSFLGYPLTGEMDFDQGGRVSVFQKGAIYWWPDTGAIELGEVVVHYTGLNCFGETDVDVDDTPGADEPYVLLNVVTPMGIHTLRSQIYGDVDGGESRPDLVELYRGAPLGLMLNVLLLEHTAGNANECRDKLDAAVRAKLGRAAPPPDPESLFAQAINFVLNILPAPVSDFASSILGDVIQMLSERPIGGLTPFVITPKQMILLATRTLNKSERQIGFKLETPLLRGYGASYKVYFGIVPA